MTDPTLPALARVVAERLGVTEFDCAPTCDLACCDDIRGDQASYAWLLTWDGMGWLLGRMRAAPAATQALFELQFTVPVVVLVRELTPERVLRAAAAALGVSGD